ncbi:hypothetical protein D3C72_950090 [compost metagenome]
MQGQRQDFRRRIKHRHAAGFELFHVLRFEHQIPAVHRRVVAQCRFDFGRVEADQHSADHVRHAVLVARIVLAQQFQQLRILVAPVRQFRLVEFLEHASLDLRFKELV